MTYTLTPEEIEKVRNLIRVILDTYDGILLTPKQQEECIELAQEIKQFIQ